ncbi:hypothetical protein QR680_000334 [Steinernema hermaphroditum]|uniref:Uncharacterized protein n=1 Tax=Steinernema hermaphroditum TaxID=289476 RepID=A0AA39GUE6_9BILA|nr:hypothetical protein QR680_000334 [Steinernema hermaphroditum]
MYLRLFHDLLRGLVVPIDIVTIVLLLKMVYERKRSALPSGGILILSILASIFICSIVGLVDAILWLVEASEWIVTPYALNTALYILERIRVISLAFFLSTFALNFAHRTYLSNISTEKSTIARALCFVIPPAYGIFMVTFVTVSCFGYVSESHNDKGHPSFGGMKPWMNVVDTSSKTFFYWLAISIGYWNTRILKHPQNFNWKLIPSMFMMKAWIWISRTGALLVALELARLLLSFTTYGYVRSALEALPSVVASVQVLIVTRVVYGHRQQRPTVDIVTIIV